jgi:hypothetical protein
MRNKNAEDYHALAATRSFQWVDGEVPPLASHKTTWRCVKGHTWEASYSAIRAGNSCPYCSNHIPKSQDDYHRLAHSRNFQWVGEVPPFTTHTKTPWQCPVGHLWNSTFQSIQGGSGCPHCAGLAPKTAQDYHNLAAERGFQWIGSESPVNNHTKTLWQCSKDHTWQAVYRDIYSGRGCPYCAGKAPKTDGGYHSLAAQRGFQWVGDVLPDTTFIKTKWRCGEGHTWESRYNDLSNGSGCPYCAGITPKTAQDYHNLAAERGFQWVGDVLPINVKAKTLWRCSSGHEWEAVFGNVLQGTGCPHCLNLVNGYRVSTLQQAICEMVGGELNINVSGFIVDIVLSAGHINIAIEYDGWYWHKERLAEDGRRDRALIEAGWRVLRIKSGGLLPYETVLHEAVEELCQGQSYVEIVLEDWGE